MIYKIFFVAHKNEQKMNKEKATTLFEILCSSIKSSKNP